MYCWFVCINLYEMGSMYRWYHLPYAFVHSPLLHHMWPIVTALFIASRSQNCTFQPQLPPKQFSNDWWFQPIPKIWVMFGSSSYFFENTRIILNRSLVVCDLETMFIAHGWPKLYELCGGRSVDRTTKPRTQYSKTTHKWQSWSWGAQSSCCCSNSSGPWTPSQKSRKWEFLSDAFSGSTSASQDRCHMPTHVWWYSLHHPPYRCRAPAWGQSPCLQRRCPAVNCCELDKRMQKSSTKWLIKSRCWSGPLDPSMGLTFFPTCQVRVVRIDQNCSSPSPHPPPPPRPPPYPPPPLPPITCNRPCRVRGRPQTLPHG